MKLEVVRRERMEGAFGGVSWGGGLVERWGWRYCWL